MLKDLASGEVPAPSDGTLILTKIPGRGRQWRAAYGDRGGPDQGGFGGGYRPREADRLFAPERGSGLPGESGAGGGGRREGVPDRRFRGKVVSVGAVAYTVTPWDDPTANPNEHDFDIKVTLFDVDPKVLRPGMKAEATFVLARLRKAVLAPLAAIIHRPGKEDFVRVQRGSWFEEQAVETGERNDQTIVIRKGLQRGDRVALVDTTKGGTP